MHRNAGAVVVSVTVLLFAACSVRYPLRGVATMPFGTTVNDGRSDFARVFCATLTHLDPQHTAWGACAQYLEGDPPEQPDPELDIPSGWRVLAVGGIFSHCFERHEVNAFEQGLKHLQDEHGIPATLIRVGGVTTPEENARIIAAYVRDNPGKYIAVGHSKGAVDLMAALQGEPDARASMTRTCA